MRQFVGLNEAVLGEQEWIMADGDVLWNEGTTITWTDSGGDEQLDLGGPDGDSGDICVGSYHDFGVGPRAFDYRLHINIDGFNTSPVVGQQVQVYITEGQTSNVFTGPETPNDTTDTSGDIDRLPNLLGPFFATVWSTVAGNSIVASYQFRSSMRYLAPVVYNATNDDFLSTGDLHVVSITPLYPSVAQS